MTKSRGINAPKAVWTSEQIAVLWGIYPKFKTADVATMIGHTTQQVYRKANALGLAKSLEFYQSEASGRTNGQTGSGSRFVKGAPPWNKGLKFQPGGRSVESRFKPGQAPPNTLPIGSTKFDKSGRLLQKVSDNPGNNSQRWRGVHELVWVEANGPVPPKHIVVFKPGMATNVLEEITVDRVECISLVENMKRNSLHNMPKELAQLVQLRGALNRQINKRSST